ncbi:MAG: hypothetical protein E6Y88_02125, partial [Proteus mirabilis]|nr:hypothetical protein [Proteus mirabilis]
PRFDDHWLVCCLVDHHATFTSIHTRIAILVPFSLFIMAGCIIMATLPFYQTPIFGIIMFYT